MTSFNNSSKYTSLTCKIYTWDDNTAIIECIFYSKHFICIWSYISKHEEYMNFIGLSEVFFFYHIIHLFIF